MATSDRPVIYLVETIASASGVPGVENQSEKLLISAPDEETVRFWLSRRRYIFGEPKEITVTRLGTLEVEIANIDHRH